MEEIEDFAHHKEKWLKKYLELHDNVPSSGTIRIVAGNTGSTYFYQTVIQFMEALVNDLHNTVKGQGNKVKIISMDGQEFIKKK